MKKSVILGLSVVLILGAYVSAEDLSGSTTPPICQKTGCQNRIMINGMRQEIKGWQNVIKSGNQEIKITRRGFHEDFGYARNYLNKGLTGDQRAQAIAILTGKNAAIKAINKEIQNLWKNKATRTGINRDEYKTKLTTVFTTFQTQITPYIDPAKLESFNKFIAGKITTIESRMGIKKNNAAMYGQIQSKRQEIQNIKGASKK